MAGQEAEPSTPKSDPAPRSKYMTDYDDVLEAIEDGDFETAITWAYYNLTDSTLPRYWQVKNLLIMAAMTTDWNKADEWLVEAERIWTEAKDDMSAEDDFAQGWLRSLRIDLDYLRNAQEEAAKMWSDESEDEEDEDEDGGDGDEDGGIEDEDEVGDEDEDGDGEDVGDVQMKEHQDVAPPRGEEQPEDADQVAAAG